MSDRSRGAVERKARQIGIYPFENVDLTQFRDSLEAASRIYGLEPGFFLQDVFLTSKITELEKSRRQRDAFSIIQAAKKSLHEDSSSSMTTRKRPRLGLLITNQDMFADNMNFVFGLASSDFGIAVVSIARLVMRYDEEEGTLLKVQERILKEASHEIGHLLGLSHCQNSSCLMSFSETLSKVDEKLPAICPSCRKKLLGRQILL